MKTVIIHFAYSIAPETLDRIRVKLQERFGSGFNVLVFDAAVATYTVLDSD